MDVATDFLFMVVVAGVAKVGLSVDGEPRMGPKPGRRDGLMARTPLVGSRR